MKIKKKNKLVEIDFDYDEARVKPVKFVLFHHYTNINC